MNDSTTSLRIEDVYYTWDGSASVEVKHESGERVIAAYDLGGAPPFPQEPGKRILRVWLAKEVEANG